MAQLATELADMMRSPTPELPGLSEAMCGTVNAALDAVAHGGPDLATVLESVSLLGLVDQLRRELSGETAEVSDAESH
jgi:hypothetical protein